MSEYELLLRAAVKLIVLWSPVWTLGLILLFFLAKEEKKIKKRRQAIKRTERKVA